MAEHVNVNTGGGFVEPPLPDGVVVHQRSNAQPSQANMVPGFVPPAPAQAAQPAGMSAADVQAQIDAALAQSRSEPAPNAAYDFDTDALGDPVLTSMANMFLGAVDGIDIERAVGNALTHGNAQLIDYAYIQEAGGAQAEHLATIAQAIVERVQSQTDDAAANVYSSAGGKPQWDAAAAAFNRSAPAHLRTVIAGLMDSGSKEALQQAAQTVLEYTRQGGLTVSPAKLLHSGASGGSAAQALGKFEFQELHRKLDPNSRTYQQDRQTLMARRQIGKQLGR